MKKLELNYVFDASAQTVQLTDYAAVNIEGVLLITNVVDGLIIFNFANTAKGGTVAGNTITLEYDTTLMSDTDELQIWYDDGDYDQLVYGSDDGGTTKRVIKTDAGGALQVDLEVASVTVTSGNITAETELTTADLDTGGGTDTRAVVGLVGSKSGGGELIPGSAADGLLVNLGANNDVTVTGSVTTSGTVTEANSAAIAASLSVIDDWDETDRAKVNPIAGQAGVQAGAGAVSANTQRVVLATDDPAVASLAVIDDWDETDRAKVNPIVGQAGVQGGSGAVSSNTQRVVLATDVALPTGTNSIGTVGHNITGIADGRTVVTTAGTRVVLAASTPCKKVDIQAETDNTGVIVVGGTTVVAALATRRGICLQPGDTYSLEIDNLNDVNLDSTVNGDGVTYTYYT